MAKAVDNKRKPTLPFAKAYNFLLKDSNLTSAEKLVMVIICRYWPNPYWDTNEQIAKDLGFSERYIEKVVKSLADKRIIKRGFAHTTKNARPHTVRVIVPKSFPVKSNAKIKWVEPPEHMDGQHTEDMDGNCPNNGSFLPEQSDDLLERSKKEINKRNKKAMLAPLPADGQASALLDDRKTEQKSNIERFKQEFGKGKRWQPGEMSETEFEQRKQQQIKALLASEKNKFSS